MMNIAPVLKTYLNTSTAEYELLHHAQTFSTYDSACAAHLAAEQVVKGVVLRDIHDGKVVMAVIPSDHRVNIHWLNNILNRHFELMPESDMNQLFPDCELGAVPALAQAYKIALIWDDLLVSQPELYFEAGNHQDLIRISHDQFSHLFKNQPSGRISVLKEYVPAFRSDFERYH